MLCTSLMQLDRRPLAGLLCAFSLLGSHAAAQPSPPPPPQTPADTSAPVAPAPETLETPYGDGALPVPPPAAAPRAQPIFQSPSSAELPPPTRPDKRPLGPIRARRKLALFGELGWNGL